MHLLGGDIVVFGAQFGEDGFHGRRGVAEGGQFGHDQTAVGAEFRPVIQLAPDESELGQRAFQDAHALLFVAGFGGREGF